MMEVGEHRIDINAIGACINMGAKKKQKTY